MKPLRRWTFRSAVVALVFSSSGLPAQGVVTIQPDIAVSNVKPFGVNLGFRTSWGAEQLTSNVIMNPGFEGVVDRCLVTAVPLDRRHFLDQFTWFGRSDRFWVGAGFQIRTGTAAGYTGKIVDSRKSGTRGLPEFTTAEPLPALEQGDRIAITKVNDDDLPTQWWLPSDSAGQVLVSKEARPHSPGVRSLCLRPRPKATTEIHSYLDAIGDRAGVLLPLTGSWRLAFWGRAPRPCNLSVKLGRNSGHTWVNRTVALTPRWQHIVIDFEGGEDGGRGIVDLAFKASGELLIDDVELRNCDQPASAFRREVVETLAALHPAYLRDWQGQLGDTLENRLAAPGARRASRYRPGGKDATYFGYSLPEFLDLCRAVHANPWIVAPTTFSDTEWAGLGRYLLSRAPTDRFSEVLVEFGNENWNGIFSAAGITDPARHAGAASRAFRCLLDAGGYLPIKPVMNAQYANPDAAIALGKRLGSPGVIAVAPYFLRELRATQMPSNALSALFAKDGGTLQRISSAMGPQHELSVYEVNLHTTEGDASGSSRTAVVAGAASGTALAIHLLDGLALGIRRQCVYVLSGFDYKLPNSLGNIPLWGITRDLGPTPRLRPTGLALALLNQAVTGDLHRYQTQVADLTVAPFVSKSGWSVAIASAASEAREIKLQFPEYRGTPVPSRCLVLRATSPTATNEESEQVTIAPQPIIVAGQLIGLKLPPYGLAVLLPKEVHAR